MINRQSLLTDLQRLLRQLETDLRERCDEAQAIDAALRKEYDAAREAKRTAETFEEWRADYITQIAVAWVLTCVFARFLEDNCLVDPPKLSGPGERLRRARDEHELYFRAHPTETDREYLLAVFDGLARLPDGEGIFAGHNPLRQQPGWLSGDAARTLLEFFQRIDPESGELVHDFTDTGWDTRFLGDLYQDLSETARKKYALLQTPVFVEEFILDRTLDPAIEEFGLDGFRMIDPACGSGHFLLGSFRRLLDRWSKAEPGTNARELIQRALDCVHGVDINPYAVAIARFRLLLAALRACSITRLADAPAFRFNLACGDSLLHGSGAIGSFGFDDFNHVYQAEDHAELVRILRPGYYHAVVANPPYITPKDRAMNDAYRERYKNVCHMKYSLAVPFMQRLFQLAQEGFLNPDQGGFVGQITANSFMKREFGKKLIEVYFAGRDGNSGIDLTHVIDASGAYIPGHGTPTVILFGRNRKPIAKTIRAVMGIRGEPSTPEDPARGLVWSAILGQIDQPGSQSAYVSVADSPRELFHKHPWAIGGGGASELKEELESRSHCILDALVSEIGRSTHTGEDEAFYIPPSAARTWGISERVVPIIMGELVRDYRIAHDLVTIFPYDRTTAEPVPILSPRLERHLWKFRTGLRLRKDYGQTVEERGFRWFDHTMFFPKRYRIQLSISYAEIATHNHFVVDRGGKVFDRTAPVIKLPAGTIDDVHVALSGVLNSSVVCFWLKQCAHNKGDSTDNKGARTTGDSAFNTYAFNATLVGKLPLPEKMPLELARHLDCLAQGLAANSPVAAIARWQAQSGPEGMREQSLREVLDEAYAVSVLIRGEMILMQEDLDWQCYRLYGLIDEDVTMGIQPQDERRSIMPGMRAFEVLLAQELAAGKNQTTWFERHGILPRTELPDANFNPKYHEVAERRIEVIRSNSQIALIEQPDFKRRWYEDVWGNLREQTLRDWLLNRLESYFDHDGRMNDEGKPTARLDMAVITTARLADVAAKESDFMQVAELYRGRSDFDVGRLVAELVEDESVPLLPVLRYKPAGLDKRQAWERTWDLQRQEDAIDARTKLPESDPNYLTEDQARAEKRRQVGDIPVPPKYTTADFQLGPFWRLRGKLDVPKERWVSFPHCAGEDGTLVVAWAGLDHLQLARAVSAYHMEIQEKQGGSADPRLVPLLGCVLELVPWLKQWHNDLDPEFNMRMGDYFENFVEQEARALGLTPADIRAWKPPQRTGGRGRRTGG